MKLPNIGNRGARRAADPAQAFGARDDEFEAVLRQSYSRPHAPTPPTDTPKEPAQTTPDGWQNPFADAAPSATRASYVPPQQSYEPPRQSYASPQYAPDPYAGQYDPYAQPYPKTGYAPPYYEGYAQPNYYSPDYPNGYAQPGYVQQPGYDPYAAPYGAYDPYATAYAPPSRGFVPRKRERKKMSAEELRYTLWSGSIVFGIVGTLVAFIYACCL